MFLFTFLFFFCERIDIIKNFICEKLVRYLLADKLNWLLISKEGYRTSYAGKRQKQHVGI